MSERLDALMGQYLSALRRYVAGREEAALTTAYELGRSAMTAGCGVLDVAALHTAAVAEFVVAADARDQARLADAAASFFHEALAPFEMALRGYREANEELRRLNDALTVQKRSLEDVNRELEAFSYSVSHDLRAPLRSIDGFSRILVDDFAERLGDDGRLHLERIRRAAHHMRELIESLLALARVSRATLRRSRVDLSDLARRTVDDLQRATPQRAIDVTIQDGIVVRGDQTLLGVVLDNFFANAWKFTAKNPGPAIAFGCEHRDGVPTYFVRDNGAGFDMAHAARLFRPFQRLHATSEFEGTGVGLATVQRIVHRHHGRVWATATVGEGATFFFTLSEESDTR
jgi:light-regulated signal transduction histidine kinase (bacteriophytochrome)